MLRNFAGYPSARAMWRRCFSRNYQRRTLVRVVIHSESRGPFGKSELKLNCWNPPEYRTGKIVTLLFHLWISECPSAKEKPAAPL